MYFELEKLESFLDQCSALEPLGAQSPPLFRCPPVFLKPLCPNLSGYVTVKGCSLRLTGPKSSSLRLSFQLILLEIVSK